MAENTANGATAMTNSVTFSITAATCPRRSSTPAARGPSWPMAVPTKREKITISSTSFRAMASMIEAGMTWARTPGCSTVAMVRPMPREMIPATMNQATVRTPTRPAALPPPMWATPAVRVLNTSGAMTILIKVRKVQVTRPR